MKITVIAMGQHRESWINEGFEFYKKRLPASFSLLLKEIPLIKRSTNSFLPAILEKEGVAMLNAVPQGDTLIALDSQGISFNSENFAKKLQQFQEQSQNVSFLIGSPEGMPTVCSEQAHQQWSLSALTLPHALVRVILAEAVYRSWCIIHNHPYHK